MNDDFLSELVDAEREALVPKRGSKKRTWQRVAGSVAMSVPPIADPCSVASPAIAAKSAIPWAKGVFVLVLSCAAAVGAYTLAGQDGPGTDVVAERRAGTAVAAPQQGAQATAVTAAPPAVAAELPPVEPAAPVVVTPTDAGSADPPRPRTPRLPKSAGAPAAAHDDSGPGDHGGSTLAEEARLLAEARRAFRDGAPRGALAPLGEHADRFPHGQLAEDRMALTARALCASGDLAGGKKAVVALRRAFASSSHLARVERACGA